MSTRLKNFGQRRSIWCRRVGGGWQLLRFLALNLLRRVRNGLWTTVPPINVRGENASFAQQRQQREQQCTTRSVHGDARIQLATGASELRATGSPEICMRSLKFQYCNTGIPRVIKKNTTGFLTKEL